jgi:hypothetical protein
MAVAWRARVAGAVRDAADVQLLAGVRLPLDDRAGSLPPGAA